MTSGRETSISQSLAGVRVLEVAEGVAGPYCGKLLASLGAGVLKVERPGGGDPSRREGPFPGDVPHPESSGLFLYLNTGKRGITLDLDDAQGRALLAEVASGVDVLVTDRQPGQGDAGDTEFRSLRDANPGLIVATVTPFGTRGPYAAFRAHDLNVFHAGGEGYLLPNGLALDTFPERAPLAAGSRMGSYQGGLTAALAVVAAVHAKRNGGPGQEIDCSLQEAQLNVGYVPIQRLESEGVVEDRFSRYFRVGGVLPASDGYVELLTLEPRQWQGLGDLLGQPEWATMEKFQNPAEYGPEINTQLREWFQQHSKEWLYREGQEKGVPIAPYYSPGEVFNSAQQRERGLFQEIGHPVAGRHEYAGPPLRAGGDPPQTGRAPLLGEHNRQVFGGLGYSPEEIVELARAGVI